MTRRGECKFFVLCAARLTLRGNCRKLKVEGNKKGSFALRNRTARIVSKGDCVVLVIAGVGGPDYADIDTAIAAALN